MSFIRRPAVRGATLAFLSSLMAFAAPGAIPNPPFSEADIGAPGSAGSATFDPATMAWTAAGGGGDIWGTADQFHFVYMSLSGDGTLTARVTSQGNTDPWAKAGVMIRETTAAGAKFALAAVTPGNGHVVQWRDTTDGGANWPGSSEGGSIPYYIRLTRQGTSFTGYSSPDGVAWNTLGTVAITMTASTLAGFAVTAHNNAALSTVAFDNFTIEDGAGNALWPPPPAAPALSIATPQNYTPVVNLSWTVPASVAPITAYAIFRGSAAGNETLYQTVSASTTTYSDTGVFFGGTYFYVVQAASGAAASPDSNEVSGSPQSLPPRTTKLGSENDQCGCGTAGAPDFGAVAGGAALLLLLSLALRR
jgi:hypothetical protein